MSGANAAFVERALEWWSSFGLASKRTQWELMQAEISHTFDASQASVRNLASYVKNYRKVSDEDKIAQTEELLKLVQDEVTSLSKRAKNAEKAFLQMFASLAEAPDPAAPLSACKDATRNAARLSEDLEKTKAETNELKRAIASKAEMAVENAKLKTELQMLESELSKLQNQDITIRDLERRITEYEAQVDQQVNERLIEREMDLKRVFEAELEAVREAETAAESRVVTLRQALADAIAARDEAQAALYTTRSELRSDDAARQQVEIESLLRENELLTARVAGLTAELEVTKHHLASATTEGLSLDARSDPVSVLRAQLESARSRIQAAAEENNALRNNVRELQDDIAKWQGLAQHHKSAMGQEAQELRSRLTAKENEVDALTAELKNRPSQAEVATLRQQLSLLQAAVFNSVEGESVGDEQRSEASGGTGELDAHSLLIRRLRQLEDAALRANERTELLEGKLSKAKEELQATSRQNLELTQQLEKAEAALEQKLSLSSPSMQQTAPAHPGHQLSAQSQLEALFSASDAVPSARGVGDVEPGLQPASHVVEALKGQRDRMRTRMTTLENELQHRTAQLADALAKTQQLNEDNVKLYGKIKYLQSFMGTNRAGTNNAVEVRNDDETEKKYNKLYQEANDPFTDFSRRERAKQYDRLSAAERITLSSSRIFLGSKFARTFVFFYVLVLHLLVFATLWHFVHVSHGSCEHGEDHAPSITGATGYERLIPQHLRGTAAT